MNTENQKLEYVEKPGRVKSILTGMFVGGLVGAGTMLLLAPQPGAKTRAEVQQGVTHFREQTSTSVKDKITQVKSKANQLKEDVQSRAVGLQHQGQELLVKQLDRVSQAAEAGKKALRGSHNGGAA